MVVDVALVVLWLALVFTAAGLWLARYNARVLHGPDTAAGPPRWAAVAVTAGLAVMSLAPLFWPGGHETEDALLAQAAAIVRAQHPNSAQLTKAMTAQLNADEEQGDLTVYYTGNSAVIKLWNMPNDNVRATVERQLTVSLDGAGDRHAQSLT